MNFDGELTELRIDEIFLNIQVRRQLMEQLTIKCSTLVEF